MSDPGIVTVTVQKNTPTAGSNGDVDSWSDVSGMVGLSARKRNRNPQPWSYASAGGADRLETEEILIFAAPYPAITEQHRIQVVGGKLYSVLKCRAYLSTLQLDIQVIE